MSEKRFKKKEKVKKTKKPRTKKDIVYNILICLFATTFLISGGFLLRDMYFLPKMSDDAITEIEQELYAELEILQESNNDIAVDLESEEAIVETYTSSLSDAVAVLREKYPDLVGWIKIENTDVHFPVMKSDESDPEYYLRRNYKGESITYGSIFHDGVSDVDSVNQILHGHNMRDGRMFACLNDYYDIEFYQTAPTIEYTTYEEEAIWKIIAIFEIKVTDDDYFKYIVSDFKNDEAKQEYIDTLLELSVIDTGVDVNVDDYFLTLSTCSSDPSNYRTVVVARKVRDGEDPSVDTSLAVYN
ncbi:MAG: class B sortase [Clostridia bacterium]